MRFNNASFLIGIAGLSFTCIGSLDVPALDNYANMALSLCNNDGWAVHDPSIKDLSNIARILEISIGLDFKAEGSLDIEATTEQGSQLKIQSEIAAYLEEDDKIIDIAIIIKRLSYKPFNDDRIRIDWDATKLY